MEDEDEDQENEKEDERDGEERRVESRRVSRQQQHADGTWMTCAQDTLSPCHVPHKNVCCETRENVTCEACCSHLPSVAADCYQL